MTFWNSMAPMNPDKYAILAFCKNSRQYVTKIDIFLHARLSLSTSESPLDGDVCWAAQTSVQMILGVHQSWVSVDQNSIALARSHTASRAIQWSAVKGHTTRYSCIWAESPRACGRRRISLPSLFCQPHCWRVVKTRPENGHKKGWTNYFWGRADRPVLLNHTHEQTR